MGIYNYRVVCNFVDGARCYHPLNLAVKIAQWPARMEESLHLTLWRMFREAGWDGDGDINCFFAPSDLRSPNGATERMVIFHASDTNCSVDWLAIPPGFNDFIPVCSDNEGPDEEAPIRIMRRWFFATYENPIQNTPWDNEDKEYHFLFGDPVDAEEVLSKEFSGSFCDMDIRALVHELEEESFEWAPREPENLCPPWIEDWNEPPQTPGFEAQSNPAAPKWPVVDPDSDVTEEDDKPF